MTLTQIKDQSFHVVNSIGTVLFTSPEKDLAMSKAEELKEIHGRVSVQRVTFLERRLHVATLARALDAEAKQIANLTGRA